MGGIYILDIVNNIKKETTKENTLLEDHIN